MRYPDLYGRDSEKQADARQAMAKALLEDMIAARQMDDLAA